jgi:hypothetical protein
LEAEHAALVIKARLSLIMSEKHLAGDATFTLSQLGELPPLTQEVATSLRCAMNYIEKEHGLEKLAIYRTAATGKGERKASRRRKRRRKRINRDSVIKRAVDQSSFSLPYVALFDLAIN